MEPEADLFCGGFGGQRVRRVETLRFFYCRKYQITTLKKARRPVMPVLAKSARDPPFRTKVLGDAVEDARVINQQLFDGAFGVFGA